MVVLFPERNKPIKCKAILLFCLPDWELTERGLFFEERGTQQIPHATHSYGNKWPAILQFRRYSEVRSQTDTQKNPSPVARISGLQKRKTQNIKLSRVHHPTGSSSFVHFPGPVSLAPTTTYEGKSISNIVTCELFSSDNRLPNYYSVFNNNSFFPRACLTTQNACSKKESRNLLRDNMIAGRAAEI